MLFVWVLYVPFIRWRFVCVVFLSSLFLLSRASFFAHVAPAANRAGRAQSFSFICFVSLVFCHLPLSSSSFVYAALSLIRSPSLYAFFLLLCGRCSRSINFRWFVFFTCCVWVCVCLCTRMFLCMSASIFLCIPFFFCRPPSSDVDVGVGRCCRAFWGRRPNDFVW